MTSRLLRDDVSIGPDPVSLERADDMTHSLQQLMRSAAATVVARDPITDANVVLASTGYPQRVLDHAVNDFLDNPAIQRTRTNGSRAMRWRDIRRDWNMDFADSYSAQQVLVPAGFHEGATMCLWLPNGRYTGAAHVSWEKPIDATEDRRGNLENLRRVLAGICDLLVGPRVLAEALVGDANAIWLTARGDFTELPDRPAGPLLSAGSELGRFLLHRWPKSNGPRTFLWIDTRGQIHRVELFPCGQGDILVAEEPIPPPSRLTARELQVLHLVSIGAPYRAIADQLFISFRTVTTHVEHLLAKLECNSRTHLAAKAFEQGLLLAYPHQPEDRWSDNQARRAPRKRDRRADPLLHVPLM